MSSQLILQPSLCCGNLSSVGGLMSKPEMVKTKNLQTIVCGPKPACCMVLKIKFYWNTTTTH